MLASTPRALIVAGGGALLAVMGAIALSPVFPIGIARLADPDVGLHADWLVIGVGVAGVAVIVLGIAFIVLLRSTATPR